MTALSTMLQKKAKAKELGVAQAAKAIGISYPTFRSALLGERVPNARCVGKFAKFLGISVAAVVTAAGPKGSRRGTKRKAQIGKTTGAKAKHTAISREADRFRTRIIKKISALIGKATAQLSQASLAMFGTAGKKPAVRHVGKSKPRKHGRIAVKMAMPLKPKAHSRPRMARKRPTIRGITKKTASGYAGAGDKPHSDRFAKKANRKRKPLRIHKTTAPSPTPAPLPTTPTQSSTMDVIREFHL